MLLTAPYNQNNRHSEKKYLLFLSYLQIIGIILVVFGHSMHEYNEFFGNDLLIYRMMYSFRMPLFLFVSGFLLIHTTVSNGKQPSLTAFVSKKFRRLIVPFIVLTLVAFLPRTMMSSMADDALNLSWGSLVSTFVTTNDFVIPYYWFLYTSFTLLAVTYACIRVAQRSRRCSIPLVLLALVALLLALNLSGLPIVHTPILSIGNTIQKGIFFLAGALYCCYYHRLEPSTEPLLCSPLFLATSATIWALLFWIAEGTAWMPLCSLSGIIMCLSLAKIIVACHVTLLDHLRGSTYMIFLLSWFFNVASQQVLAHFTDFDWWVYSLLSFFTGIYGPWAIYRLVRSYRYTTAGQVISLLLGQNTSV